MCSEADGVCVASNLWSDITGCMLMVKWSSALGHSHCFIFVLDGYCMLKKMISQPCINMFCINEELVIYVLQPLRVFLKKPLEV